MYVDWLLEGKSLWSTLVENAVPAILAIGVVVAGYVVYANRNDQYMRTLTTWQYLGAAGILVVALEVVGLQLVQGELKPRLIIIQMTIGGAIAGTLVGYANARSADARKTAERERDKFETLFENSPAERAEVRLAADDMYIEAVNEPFERTFGITGASAVGERLFATVDHDTDIESELRQNVAAATEYETELHTATDDGQKDFQLRVVPFGDEQRAYLLYTDVSDLQEPARMVSSYMSLLDSEYGDELDEEAREYIDFATDGANRMQGMIDGLLDYSRVRTNAQEFTAVDADDVFERTLEDLGLLIDEHDVTVTHGPLPTVEADERQLGQLFQNLVENAIEHGGNEVHVGTETGDGETIFSVEDNGEGIPENRQDRIFELFEQGSRDDEGTGIGLAICDRIVSRHGGEIWVESAEGEGTTFFFSIPS